MSESYLLDANILLRTLDETSDKQEMVLEALARLSTKNARLYIASQTLFEFWAVATRPVISNGLGLTTIQVAREIANFRLAFELLPETPLFDEWQRLVTTYNVSGKPTHDARYVAAMKVHGIDQILTFNGSDFVRFVDGEKIAVTDPREC